MLSSDEASDCDESLRNQDGALSDRGVSSSDACKLSSAFFAT
jgi:hypothetical protein